MEPDYLGTIFNSINDLIFVCNLNYGKTLSHFTLINAAACRRLEYTKSELLRTNLLAISHNSEKELVSVVENLISAGQTNFDIQLFTKSKKKILVEFSANMINNEGRQTVILSGREPIGRKRIEEKLTQTTEQLRNLSSHIQSVREEERTSIAREIHDELGQVLTILKIQITLLSKELRKDQRSIKERMESSARLIEDTVESIQRIAAELRPGILDELGLIAAIEWQIEEFNKRTKINYEYDLPEEQIELNREKATAVFRIFQEAMTNVVRHSNASKVMITLETIDGTLSLNVIDDGKGITQNQVSDSKSLGILGMKERALLFGGSVEIKSNMKSGTIVKVLIPLDN